MNGHMSGRPLAPISRIDVFQVLLERLERGLEVSGIEPGDRLPSERELARRMNVSRTLVRQAFKVLESGGRIEIRRGKGAYFTGFGGEAGGVE